MDANDTVFFLDRAEDEILLRSEFAAASPFDGVAAQRGAPEVLRIDAVEDCFEIEITALRG